MNGTEVESAAVMQRPRWRRRRWLAWTAAMIVGVAMMAVFGLEWGLRQVQPLLRRKVVETLSARFHSPVELDRLSLSMSKGVTVTGGGLRILSLAGRTQLGAQPDARPNASPMLTVESFEFSTGWRELLRPTTRVVSVKVQGLQVNVPPKEERGVAMPDDSRRRGQPSGLTWASTPAATASPARCGRERMPGWIGGCATRERDLP